MFGVEIDFVAKDSLAALQLYQAIFDVEVIEATNLSIGQNEVVFTLYGTRFHLLDENTAFGLLAPKEGDPKPLWFNISVPDIKETYAKAMAAGCTELQPITHLEDFGVSNALFSDPFGYLWMLHQIHKVVPFEERMAFFEQEETE